MLNDTTNLQSPGTSRIESQKRVTNKECYEEVPGSGAASFLFTYVRHLTPDGEIGGCSSYNKSTSLSVWQEWAERVIILLR